MKTGRLLMPHVVPEASQVEVEVAAAHVLLVTHPLQQAHRHQVFEAGRPVRALDPVVVVMFLRLPADSEFGRSGADAADERNRGVPCGESPESIRADAPAAERAAGASGRLGGAHHVRYTRTPGNMRVMRAAEERNVR